MSMKPMDMRLWRYAQSTRGFFVLSVVLGLLSAACVVAQAYLLAQIVAGVFARELNLTKALPFAGALLLTIVARAVVAWLSETTAFRCAAGAKSELRRQVFQRIAQSNPMSIKRETTGEFMEVVTRGIDALDGYFSRYLSQLVLAALVPVVVLIAVLQADWQSGVLFLVTLPAIPVFMTLIGRLTSAQMSRQFEALTQLSGHFLEIVRGLPTLSTFGKAEQQVKGIVERDEALRQATMRNLRLAFLSGAALELISTLGVAFVAVSVGFRLIDNRLPFDVALMVLMLAPEVYLPLRQVGTQFHANVEGLGAAQKLFVFLDKRVSDEEEPLAEPPDIRRNHLLVDNVTFTWPFRFVPALSRASFDIEHGRITALEGPSGSGKSTLFALLMGFAKPDSGVIRIGATELHACDIAIWRQHVAWVSQRTHLFEGTVFSNVAMANSAATEDDVAHALQLANASVFVEALPRGMHTHIAERGALLSAGQRQRIALARAFVRDAPLVLLDEPTAHLDTASEKQVIVGIKRLIKKRTVVIATHSAALLAMADRVVVLRDGKVVDVITKQSDIREKADVDLRDSIVEIGSHDV